MATLDESFELERQHPDYEAFVRELLLSALAEMDDPSPERIGKGEVREWLYSLLAEDILLGDICKCDLP